MKQKVLFLMLLLLLGLAGGSVMAGEPVVERQAGVKNSSDIVYWTLPTDPAVPANPIAVSWEDKGSEGGYNRFGFTLPTTDVDGNPIDQMKLSYSIYTDEDQLFTFDAETYSDDIEEDLTEIPFSIYKNAWDFYEGAVYFYRTNAEGYEPLFTNRLGIQVHYTVAGVKNSSDIVYLYPLPAVAVNFVNNKDNSDLMTENADKKADATIEGRTIFAPSKWNTLLPTIRITPMLSSMPKNSMMIGISVSTSSPLMVHPKKLYADFRCPRFVSSRCPMRSIKNIIQVQKYTRFNSPISCSDRSNPNSSTAPTIVHSAAIFAKTANSFSAMLKHGSTYLL